MNCLTAEAVKSAALTLEGVDDVEGSDGLALGVLGVGDSVADDTLEEGLENTAGLLVDHGGDTLDTTTTSQTTNGGLGDSLDVVTKYFPVTLGAPLSQSLASLSTTSHFEMLEELLELINLRTEEKLNEACKPSAAWFI